MPEINAWQNLDNLQKKISGRKQKVYSEKKSVQFLENKLLQQKGNYTLALEWNCTIQKAGKSGQKERLQMEFERLDEERKSSKADLIRTTCGKKSTDRSMGISVIIRDRT